MLISILIFNNGTVCLQGFLRMSRNLNVLFLLLIGSSFIENFSLLLYMQVVLNHTEKLWIILFLLYLSFLVLTYFQVLYF